MILPQPNLLHIATRLASPKLTLAGFALLGAAAIAVYQLGDSAAAWLAGPLLLLAVNLIGAVASNGVFRRQLPLLVFHLALIALVLLAAISRLTYLKGAADVTEGTAFGGLWRQVAGPLHPDRLNEVQFINEGFDISYKPGPLRDLTLNRVRWIADDGRERVEQIADNRPLVSHGYRFYPSSNKGFAPVLLWLPKEGVPVLGAVHLPSFPVNRFTQSRDWRPAGAKSDIWIMLDVPEDLIPADRASRFNAPQQYPLVLRRGDLRREMRPGERVSLPDGDVEYRELRTWMGYSVFYDWTLPWMLSACVVAVLSMGAHFWNKFAAKPWNREN
ncbi:MAG: cytochrome c biogenesis protein ResB [Sideroxyarcus sp.]|nr:cytochrome c biogenesis protein ResB [Sideroxyarcus sp.]